MCKITVFTATYNRKHLLEKLYESLKKQTNKDFEWLIIDDESSDQTDELVNLWIKKENNFSIRYMKQNHGGKHRALNKGFFEAKGEYFFIVDSDDYLTDNAIEIVCKWIETIEKSDEKLAGIAGLKAYQNGVVSGGTPKINKDGYIDTDCFSREKYNLTGEKAEVFKVEVLKQYLFPEFEGEFFVTEDVCWNSIYGDGYKLRWFNEVIYIFEYLDDGLTKTGLNEINGHVKNYNGYCYYIKQSLELFGALNRPRLFKTFIEVAKQKNRSFSQMAEDLKISRIQLLNQFLLLPFGFAKSGIRILKKDGIKAIIDRFKYLKLEY
ncbi:glycosyltransferase family 2 protein [Clostridium sp. NSJ-145]|uniref:glycosyltransferase family 2 protein n=1 Tax=Clostridium sp. NSJ-145 TaxID=2897777 RepID=UPI001E535D45|nr:glycosyltransferase family 2 protein [Clostridium sp. NSJ-145]MCD2502359.1 glycosyltransferase family 2 protein [Clostridium sp. NSJ-145]